MNHSAFDHLPVAVFAMAPELAALSWPQESRSTCTNCAVGGPVPHSTPERPFDASVRCCTYYPSHPNYLVGQALRRLVPAAHRRLGRDGGEVLLGQVRDGRRLPRLPEGVPGPLPWVFVIFNACCSIFMIVSEFQ